MRDAVEKCKNKNLSPHVRDFMDIQETICNSYDKKNPTMYERWKKERDGKDNE